jgi:hypothetical protein
MRCEQRIGSDMPTPDAGLRSAERYLNLFAHTGPKTDFPTFSDHRHGRSIATLGRFRLHRIMTAPSVYPSGTPERD